MIAALAAPRAPRVGAEMHVPIDAPRLSLGAVQHVASSLFAIDFGLRVMQLDTARWRDDELLRCVLHAPAEPPPLLHLACRPCPPTARALASRILLCATPRLALRRWRGVTPLMCAVDAESAHTVRALLLSLKGERGGRGAPGRSSDDVYASTQETVFAHACFTAWTSLEPRGWKGGHRSGTSRRGDAMACVTALVECGDVDPSVVVQPSSASPPPPPVDGPWGEDEDDVVRFESFWGGSVRFAWVEKRMTHLAYAAHAAVPPALSLLLAHPRCTDDVVCAVDAEGKTALDWAVTAYETSKHDEPPSWPDLDGSTTGRLSGATMRQREAVHCAVLLARRDKDARHTASARPLSGNAAAAHAWLHLLKCGDMTTRVTFMGATRPAFFWLACAGLAEELRHALQSYTDRLPHCPTHTGTGERADGALDEAEVDTAFATACEGVVAAGEAGAARGDDFLACAHLLLATGRTTFFSVVSAARCGLPTLLAPLLASPLCTAEAFSAAGHDGHTAFTAALEHASREGVAECLALLLGTGRVDPASSLRGGCTAVFLAAAAGHPASLAALLSDTRCTDEVLTTADQVGGLTPYEEAALHARNALDAGLPRARAKDYDACVALLQGRAGAVPRGVPQGPPGVWMGQPCLPHFLPRLLDSGQGSVEVLSQRDGETGHTAFSALCHAVCAPALTREERGAHAACALSLVQASLVVPTTRACDRGSHVHWAAAAGLPAALSALLAGSALDVVRWADIHGQTPLRVVQAQLESWAAVAQGEEEGEGEGEAGDRVRDYAARADVLNVVLDRFRAPWLDHP